MSTLSRAARLSLADLEAFDAFATDHGRRERRFCCLLPGICQGKPIDAAHRTLSVNIETGMWHCNRCDGRGRLEGFGEAFEGNRRHRKSVFVLRPIETTAPPPAAADEWRRHLAGLTKLHGTAGAAYLTGRGIDGQTAHAAGVRFSPNWLGHRAVVFPIRDRGGELVAAQGRYIDEGRQPKAKSVGSVKSGAFATPNAWGSDPLILVEGPIDALTLHGAGRPAVALMGAASRPGWLLRACAGRSVLVAFDGDAAGDQAATALATELRPLAARVDRLRPNWFKDWNDLAPRLSEGLRASLGAVLETNHDPEYCWRRLRETVTRIAAIMPEGAVVWADHFRPDLVHAMNEHEHRVGEAFETGDGPRLEQQLAAWLTAHSALAAAFGAADAQQGTGGAGDAL